MGIVVGYRNVKSRGYYNFCFEINGQEFSNVGNHDIQDPKEALEIYRALKMKGIFPRINRTIMWHYEKTRDPLMFEEGYYKREPIDEELTIQRLERIVEIGESLPEFKDPIVESDYGD